MLRRLIRVTEGIANECYQDNEKLEDILEQTEKQVFDVVQNRASSDFVPIRQVALETLDSIQSVALKNAGAVTGVSTGFYDLDARTAGLQKSDLILIAARPSMGKTAFVLNIAENVAIKNNITTVIFSLEMSRVQLAKRLISMNSHVDSQKIRTGQLEDQEWRDLTESTNLGESALVIDDTPGISIAELRSKCRKLKLEKNLGLIIIDYLQLMSGSGGNKNESRQQEISDISRSLKALAREVDDPVIALSQLSRAVEKRDDKRPMLSDLRESGAIEQDADVVMFIYRDEYYNKDSDSKGITEIIIGNKEMPERQKIWKHLCLDDVTVTNDAIVFHTVGEYSVSLTLADESGNSKQVEVPVLVGTEPTFLGIEDLTVTTGAENVDYLSGVTATDSNGNDLTDKIECDDSKVDLSLAGEYEITYTVTDENGFTAKQTAKVTVADGKTSKEGYQICYNKVGDNKG